MQYVFGNLLINTQVKFYNQMDEYYFLFEVQGAS